MPNIDGRAKAWQLEQARRFGAAVAARRGALGLTAVQLSSRTKDIGYPMTRSTIARIEGNHRAGKVDFAEIVTLAAALDTAPTLLLFPDLIDGDVAALPDRLMTSEQAHDWFRGIGSPFPDRVRTAASASGDRINAANLEFHSAIAPLRLAEAVRHARVLLSVARRSGTRKEVAECLLALDRAKVDARRAGLVVDDTFDAIFVLESESDELIDPYPSEH